MSRYTGVSARSMLVSFSLEASNKAVKVASIKVRQKERHVIVLIPKLFASVRLQHASIATLAAMGRLTWRRQWRRQLAHIHQQHKVGEIAVAEWSRRAEEAEEHRASLISATWNTQRHRLGSLYARCPSYANDISLDASCQKRGLCYNTA